MAELYNYILTTYKVVVGLVTTERLILASLVVFGFYLVWVCMALLLSAQKKFNQRCNSLYAYIKKNQMDSTNLQVVDMKIEKISSGFYHGWKKFKSSVGKKPSDFINRHDALDVEVNGGILNQGKTLMRAFINFTCAILFIFNFAYLGSEAAITCYLVAETMILPFILFVILKVFYFLYTSIKQQLYRMDIESYYELVNLLDETFGEEVEYEPVKRNVKVDVTDVQDDEKDEKNEAETLENEETTEEVSEETPNEETAEDENDPLKKLEKYDIFKKKNIDVNKILNEIPQTTQTTLPYIDVDSDYVIKDDENVAASKIVRENETGSSLLGGMMQDMNSIKKSNSSFIDVDKPVAEIDKEKLEEIASEEKQEESKETEKDPFGGLEQFAVAENVNPETEEKVEETEKTELETSEIVADEPVAEHAPAVEEPVVVPVEPEKDIAEIQRESIASVVSEFKSEKSKLASGGVVIERNEPIARRERPKVESVVESFDELEYEEPVQESVQEEYYPRRDEVNKLDINENTDNILNSIKTSAGGYEQPTYSNYNAGGYAQQNYNAGFGYQNPNQAYVPTVDPYATTYMNQQSYNTAYQNNAYVQNPYDAGQPSYNQNFDAFNQQTEYDSYEENVEEIEEEKPAKKTVKRTKENEPRPRNLRSKGNEKMSETVAESTKTRGRPKKQEVSETMTIKNDKEFDEVLSRAEKLMRKSDEGLSSSQSKRVEKELKMLMDAMNRYKENK